MISLEQFAAALDLLKEAMQRGDTESVAELKQLYKRLAHHAYLEGDAKVYAELIKGALAFADELDGAQHYAFLVSIFEVAHEDIPLVEYAHRQNKPYLTWKLIQHHDLDKFSLEQHQSGDTIQPFLMRVRMELLGNASYLPSLNEVKSNLKVSIEAGDTESVSLQFSILSDMIRDAVTEQDARRLTEILQATKPLLCKAAQKGHMDYIAPFLNLEVDEVSEVQTLIRSGNEGLLYWTMLDKFHFEALARQMPLDRAGVQAFKSAVLKEIGVETPLRTPEELLEDLPNAMANGEEDELTLLGMEMEALIKQSFLDDDAEAYARCGNLIMGLTREVLAQGDYETLRRLLCFDADVLDSYERLLASDEVVFAYYLLMEEERLEEQAIHYSVNLDRGDIIRVAAFRKAALEEASMSAGDDATAAIDNPKWIKSAIAYVANNPTESEKALLKVKIDLALRHAYHQMDPERYVSLIREIVTESKALLYPKMLEILWDILDVTKEDMKNLSLMLEYDRVEDAVSWIAYFQHKYRFQPEERRGFDSEQPQRMQLPVLDEFEEVLMGLVSHFAIPRIAGPHAIPSSDGEGSIEGIDAVLNEASLDRWSQMIPVLMDRPSPRACLKIGQAIEDRQGGIKILVQNMEMASLSDEVDLFVQIVEFKMKLLKACVSQERLGDFYLVCGMDMKQARELRSIIETGEEDYIKWFLIDNTFQYRQDTVVREDSSAIGDFHTRVQDKLGIDKGTCFPIAEETLANLLKSLADNNPKAMSFYAIQLRDSVTEAFYRRDEAGVAEALRATSVALGEACRTNKLHVVAPIFEFGHEDFDEVSELLLSDSADYLPLWLSRSEWIAKRLNNVVDEVHYFDEVRRMQEQLSYDSDALAQMSRDLKVAAREAITADESGEAFGVCVRKLDILKDVAYLSGNVELARVLVEDAYELCCVAIESGHGNLIIEHMNFSEDDIALLRSLEDHHANSETLARLFKWRIIEVLQFEEAADTACLSNQHVQDFKQRVQLAVTGSEDTLLISLDELKRNCQSYLETDSPELSEASLLTAHFEALFHSTYMQEDPIAYGQLMKALNDLLHEAFQDGRELRIVQGLQVDIEVREALFHYLRKGDKDGSLRVLIENDLCDNVMALARKHGRHDGANFRISVYQGLSLIPPEATEHPIVRGIRSPHGREAQNQAVLWLQNEPLPLDYTDPFTQSMLKLIVSGYAFSEAQYYLKYLNNDEATALEEVMREMRFMHLFNHRLSLGGTREVAGMSISVEGGFMHNMLDQLQHSSALFVGNLTAVDNVIQSVNYPEAAEPALERYKRGEQVHLPLTTSPSGEDAEFEYHQTNVCLVGDLCIMADRSRDSGETQGLIIYRIKDRAALPAVIESISETAYRPHKLDNNQFLKEIEETLDLERIAEVPLLEQIAGSCTWSSGAEMIHLTAAWVFFYQDSISEGMGEVDAIDLAKERAMDYHQAFVKEDLMRLLDQYLVGKRDASIPVDTFTLALAKLRTQNDPDLCEVAERIDAANLLAEADLAKAFEHFVDKLKNEVAHEAGVESAEEAGLTDEEARKIVQLYIEHKIDEADGRLKKLLEPSSSSSASRSGPGFFERSNSDKDAPDKAAKPRKGLT